MMNLRNTRDMLSGWKFVAFISDIVACHEWCYSTKEDIDCRTSNHAEHWFRSSSLWKFI